MANLGQIVVACVVGLTVGAAERRAHAQDRGDGRSDADISVTVRLDNNAAVPEDILTYAKAYAADVYGRIGVRIAWLDRGDPILATVRPQYTMVLMTTLAAQRKAAEDGITDEVVGQAVGSARRAYVYYERVLATAAPPDRDIQTFLGYVMAHELGHLMLPPPSHASAGIMRAHFGLSSRAIVTFTEQQAVAIRERLRNDAQRSN